MTNTKKILIEETLDRLEERIEKMKVNMNYHRIEQGGGVVEYDEGYYELEEEIDVAYELIDMLVEQKEKVGQLKNLLMHSDGHSLTLYQPNTNLTPIFWEKVSDEFKEAFLEKWQEAYDAEKTSGNAGIDTISFLDEIAVKINAGKYTKKDKFDSMYQYEIDLLLNNI